MVRRFALMLVSCSLLNSGLAESPAAETKALNAIYARIEKADQRLDAQSMIQYIVEGAVAGEDQERLGQAIQTLREQQELKSSDPDFGNFRWHRGQAGVKDRNVVQMVCQNALILALGHPGKLDLANEAAFRGLLNDAAKGSLNQKVRPDSTNLFLRKATNLILLGQYLDQPELSQQGRAQLREWFLYTKANGINEFNSATETGLHIDCAILIVRFSRNAQDQKLGQTLLRLLWSEVAAHWFEPAQRLGGAHSHDSNFLLGIGSLDFQFAVNGWLPGAKPDVLSAQSGSKVWLAPKEWTDSIRATLPREILQRWGQAPGQTASHWMTKNFSLGTCGTSKASDDKVFAFQFDAARQTPMVYFVMDARNDPYGKSPAPDSTGRRTALHLRPTLATVQNKDRVLLMAAEDTERPNPLRPGSELRGLWSHWVFPAAATIHFADGSLVAPGPIPNDKPVFIRLANAVLGLQIHQARKNWTSSAQLPVELSRDGDSSQAARITIQHGTGPHPGKALIAFSAQAALVPDQAAFLQFAELFSTRKSSFSFQKSGIAEICVRENNQLQSIRLDLLKGSILELEGAAELPAERIFSLNGEDLWRPLIEETLQEFSAVPISAP